MYPVVILEELKSVILRNMGLGAVGTVLVRRVREVWLAKQKAVSKLYSDWEESYAIIPKLLAALQYFGEGTVVDLRVGPYYNGDIVD
ncbi:hypothetical protein PIB30_007865 [Stylosanthes scabra]|uniref:Uncharacterized protein n=1 Tax=Stylosanthes scabra TaxID=79078 RepID=A0ABU6R3J8_9FABA|nr:hypothetical protein [Stylosanthes scabra]